MQNARPVSFLRLGLVGAGGYGTRHLEALDTIGGRSNARLVAVADPFPGKLPQLAEKEIRGYASMEQMLDGEELDAVIIAAPIPRHFSMTKLALDHGLHVYLEKPPVPLIQQLDELIALDGGERVCVGFQLVHSEPIHHLKQIIAGGKLGKLVSIRGGGSAPRRRSYYTRAAWAGRMTLHGEPVFDGPMTNALAHVLQNIMYLGGTEENSYASPREIRAELYRGAEIESYDSSCVKGFLDSGASFFFAATHASREIIPHTLEIRGTRGWVRLEGKTISSSLPLDFPARDAGELPLPGNVLNFLRHLQGETGIPRVRLADTRGFTLATNGAWVSSGKIHSIAPEYRNAYAVDGDPGVDVPGIVSLIHRGIETGMLFSEAGAPWAVPGNTCDASALYSLELEEGIEALDAVPAA